MFDHEWNLVIYLDPAGVLATFEHPGFAPDAGDDPRFNLALPMGLSLAY
jgi:hypothetical protein